MQSTPDCQQCAPAEMTLHMSNFMTTYLCETLMLSGCPEAIEGNTSQFSSSPMTLLKAAQQVPLDGTICEIGFNAGHSAIAYLSANPKARIISFDLGHHLYSWKALEVLQQTYPDATIQLVIGDSARSVPDFIKLHPHIKCDLIFIDGGHTYEQAMTDLKNMKALANPAGHVVIIDDVSMTAAVQQAWLQSLQDGLIEASTELDTLLLPANAQRHLYREVIRGIDGAPDTIKFFSTFTAMAVARYKFESAAP
jgi:predicted O-methyltransferase YrrM